MKDAFLLRLLGWVFLAQFLIYLAGAASCIYVGLRLERQVCADFDSNLQRTFDTATATVLALLGGSALNR